jgi:hypothetical protein
MIFGSALYRALNIQVSLVDRNGGDVIVGDVFASRRERHRRGELLTRISVVTQRVVQGP